MISVSLSVEAREVALANLFVVEVVGFVSSRAAIKLLLPVPILLLASIASAIASATASAAALIPLLARIASMVSLAVAVASLVGAAVLDGCTESLLLCAAK